MFSALIAVNIVITYMPETSVSKEAAWAYFEIEE